VSNGTELEIGTPLHMLRCEESGPLVY